MSSKKSRRFRERRRHNEERRRRKEAKLRRGRLAYRCLLVRFGVDAPNGPAEQVVYLDSYRWDI